MTNQSLEQILSEENLLAYSTACMALAEELASARKKNQFDTLLIPSRGAFPFLIGMVYSLNKMRDLGDDIQDIYKNLVIPSILAPLIPENSHLSTDTKSATNRSSLKVLLIPFTADLNIEKFDSTEDSTEYVQNTRRYWANVTASFFEEPSSREKGPYFRTFTEIILRDLEKRDEIANIYQAFPKVNSFAMIDTVVSGRASHDILTSFDTLVREKKNQNLLPYSFLIVDQNGKKLERHPTYYSYLKEKEEKKLVKMLRIPRIVSEDENTALLGVSAVVYPSLMKESKKLVYRVDKTEEEKPFFVGAGSWYINPNSTCMNHFKRFMNLVYSGIDFIFSRDYKKEQERLAALENFRQMRKDYLSYAESINLLDLKDTEIAFSQGLQQLNKCSSYETGSHVIHLILNEMHTKGLISKIRNLPGIRCLTKDELGGRNDLSKSYK